MSLLPLALGGCCAGLLVLAGGALAQSPGEAASETMPLGADRADVRPPRRLEIDSAASRIDFAIRLLLVRRLEGRFPSFAGEVELDPESGTARIEVRIDAREVMMERASHAEWARSPEFFDANNHPEIRFVAFGVPLQRFEDGGEIRGLLSLRGHSQEVTLEVLPSDCPEPGSDCPVRVEGALERSRFGMDARRVVLGEQVELTFEIHVEPAGAVEVAPLEPAQ